MLDREKTRQALEYWHLFDIYGFEEEANQLAVVARAFVEGRLIDVQTINYEAASNVVRAMNPKTYPAHQIAEKVVDAALGENR